MSSLLSMSTYSSVILGKKGVNLEMKKLKIGVKFRFVVLNIISDAIMAIVSSS